MANEKTPELRFIVEVSKSDDLAVFKAYIVYVDPKDGRIKNPLQCSWDSWENSVADLAVRAQAELKEGRFYGYEAEYSQPYTVRLRQAEIMVKTLRKIQRHLDKLEAKFGYAEDLFSYLSRVGDALGVSSYGYLVSRATSFYADNEYTWGTINQAKYFIQDAVKNIKAQV